MNKFAEGLGVCVLAILGITGALLLVLLVSFIPALAIWLVWTHCGIGAYYFPNLPEVWLHPSLCGIYGLLVVLGCIRHELVLTSFKHEIKEKK